VHPDAPAQTTGSASGGVAPFTPGFKGSGSSPAPSSTPATGSKLTLGKVMRDAGVDEEEEG
jgi:hypothetical protein